MRGRFAGRGTPLWKVYDGSESDLHGPLGTGPDGTAPESIAEEARAFGLEAELREGQNIDSLRQAFLDGATVILDLQAWRSDTTIPWAENWDDGHYVVLVGIDDKQLYVMDPLVATGYAYLPVEELMERWHDVEERDGVVRRYYQAGIFIKGREKLVSFPEAPIRLE